jgi:hypothetical protein
MHAGDRHNFGQTVSVAGGFFRKPRTVLWEYALLGEDSTFRSLLDIWFRRDLGASPFEVMPALTFVIDTSGHGAASAFEPRETRVAEVKPIEAHRVGMLIALLAWLGVDDLHCENVIIGRCEGGHLAVCPVDVESLLQAIRLPSQTLLIPSTHIHRESCGIAALVSPLASDPDAVAALCSGYVETLEWLQRNASLVGETLTSTPGIADAPIRLILRPTSAYVRYLETGCLPEGEPPFASSELAQLERGDVPYFFRLPNEALMRYYRAPGESVEALLPAELGRPAVTRSLTLAELSSPRDASLKLGGVLQLVKTLMPTTGARGGWQTTQVSFDGGCVEARIGDMVLRAAVGRSISSMSSSSEGA